MRSVRKKRLASFFSLKPDSFAQSDFQTGPAAALGLQAQDAALCGSVLNLRGAEEAKAVQERFIRQHPHHIPLLLMLDVINGYETVFPIPLAQACSFRPELTQALCAAAAREASADGLHVTFSPMAGPRRRLPLGARDGVLRRRSAALCCVCRRGGPRLSGGRSYARRHACRLWKAFCGLRRAARRQ